MHKYANAPGDAVPIAIVGARGYSGLELIRILLKHPHASIQACFASESFVMSDYLPEDSARAIPVLPMSDFKSVASRVKVVFLATPAEVSTELAPIALELGAHVIDLSGAFRLHSPNAHYGLVPWIGPSASGSNAQLICNPGCYATSVLMAVLPLLLADLVDRDTLVIDAKSGATGAGRKALESLQFCEVEGDCLPYKVGQHAHLPEIQKYAQAFAGVAIDPMFATHLLPVRRGIISGIYARTKTNVTVADVEAAFQRAYASYPLVRWTHIDGAARQRLSMKRVVGSARTEIGFELVGTKLYVFSIIDNLMKGAASQAVENFNRLNDFSLTTSLLQLEGVL